MFPSPSAYQQPFNSTLLSLVTPTALHPPIYYNTRPSLLSSVSDKHLSLIAPFAIYWIYSLVYHALDSAKLPYFEARRLHESPEVLSRNKATVFQVIKAVVVQQIIQTILGLIWLEDDATIAKRELYRDHLGEMGQLAPCVADATLLVFGRKSGEDMLRNHGEAMVRWVYWWGIPVAQMLFAL